MDSSDQDTIAAIATPPGEAGIAIVRVSGTESLAIADRIFRHPRLKPSALRGGQFAYGHACDAAGTQLDEVILLVYREGHSYTREDVVEIQCHGGRFSARRILQAVLQAGARHAEPGEFTRRAFLNGRLDLLQAEAVIDLIRARSDRAATLAMEQLDGQLSNCLSSIYDDAVGVSADLEATLDFDEGELPPHVQTDIRGRLEHVAERLQSLLSTWNEGRLLREGALVVIAGPPNAGKSTLLNRLLGTDRAIVTEIPGTTRDLIEEQLILDGIPVRLVDTAGLRDTECRIEKAGIDKAKSALEHADLVLYVVDGSIEASPTDITAVVSMNRPCIVVANKSDLGIRVRAGTFSSEVITTDLLHNIGLDRVRSAMTRLLVADVGATSHVAVSERHRQGIEIAFNEIHHAIDILKAVEDESQVLAAQHVRISCETIGRLLGKTWSHDLLDTIFSRFCIGK